MFGRADRLNALVLAALLSMSSPAFAEVIPLAGDNGFTLDIRVDEEKNNVTVALQQYEEDWQAITQSNAGFEMGHMRRVKLCPDCAEVLFIPLYDMSSTYGATTGIIAWSSGVLPSWSLTLLPFDLPAVVDEDGDGISELVNQEVGNETTYHFEEGLIWKD